MGAGIVVAFTLSVLTFRIGSRRGVASVWSEKVADEAVDQYLSTYRAGAPAEQVMEHPRAA